MKKWARNLAALVPFYDADGGNATIIYTLDGKKEFDKRTVKWNLRRLSRFYCVDLEAARSRYGEYLECGQGVPLPLSAILVLVPLKVRKAVGKNDGSTGYFNPCAASVESGPEREGFRSLLALPGGNRVYCMYTERTVRKRLKAGELVLNHYTGAAAPGVDLMEKSGLTPEYLRLLKYLLTSAACETQPERGAGALLHSSRKI